MAEFEIRNATAADLAQAARLGTEIVRVHHATNPKRFFWFDGIEAGYAAWLGQEIQRPEAVVLVAESDGKIVGYAYGAIEPRDWSILVDRHGAFHDLCVAESTRRIGIGRALARAMIARLAQLGAPRILARAMVQNTPAQQLVEQLGFAATMIEFTRESS